MIINDYKYMYTCMYLYMHVYLAPSYISFPLCIARISREQIISHQNLTRLKCLFLFSSQASLQQLTKQKYFFSSVVITVVKATVVREELDFGDGSPGLPFPLQKNYTVQYKKRDIFKVIQDQQQGSLRSRIYFGRKSEISLNLNKMI